MSGLIETPTPATTVTGPVLFAGAETVAGRRRRTLTGSGGAWADAVLADIGPGERALVALSFAPDGPAIAHHVAPTTAAVSPAPSAADRPRHRITERPATDEYAQRIRTALGSIAAGRLQKVVLGRGLDVISEPPLDPAAILARLLDARPGRYVFGLPLSEAADGPVLLGASPELLIRRRGRRITSVPLAGSVPRVPDVAEDRRRAAALQRSTKDLTEHAFVVEAIMAALAPHCVSISRDAQPRLVSTDTLHHLGTHIRGTLAPGGDAPSALHLAQLLQPTPAVGGVPTTPALELIAHLEGEGERGPLTGAVGWVDGDGDGEFAVTIRAGILHGPSLRLYAGAGIVAGSDPASEVRETGAKLATMLRAVGL